MLPPIPDPPALCGPLRRQRQMLVEPQDDGHIDAETGAPVAEIILDHAVMTASYAAYEREAAERGRGA